MKGCCPALRFILTSTLLLMLVCSLLSSASSDVDVHTLLGGLNHPVGVAADFQGNVYFTEYGAEGSGSLRRLSKDGVLETVLSGLTTPTGVAADFRGDVYFAETSVGMVRRLKTGTGVVETVAEGLTGAWGLAVDGAGNIYVTIKSVNGTLMKVTADSGEVVELLTGLNIPYGVAVDSRGDLFFVEFGTMGGTDGTLKKLVKDSGGTVTLLDTLSNPYAVTVDSAGNVYFTEKTGTLKKLPVGQTEPVLMVSGLTRVYGLTVSGVGELYFVEFGSPIGTGDGALKKIGIPPSTVLKPSWITLKASSSTVGVGEVFNVAGFIEPSRLGVPVNITYISPDGAEVRRSVYTSPQGTFEDSFQLSLEGVWTVWAQWPGDGDYEGAVSAPVSVKVRGYGLFGVGIAEVAIIVSVVAVGVIVAVWAVIFRGSRVVGVKKRGRRHPRIKALPRL